MKAIQLAINEALPPDMRDYTRVYNKDTLNNIQADLAVKYPDDYGKIMDNIISISRDSIWRMAPTISLDDFRPVFDKNKKIDHMLNKAALARKSIKDKHKRDSYIKKLYEDTSVELEKDTYDAAKASPVRNNLFDAVASGARGNKAQLKAIITTPGIYTDYKGRTIPIFSRKSYAEGIDLPSYLASTYGTRNCLAEYTEVKMADGTLKQIKDIEPGDYVLGADKEGNTFPVKVLHKIDQGMQDCVKVTTDTKKEVTATIDHKFLS